MICRKFFTIILFLVIVLVTLTGCKDMCPRSGCWETEDKSLVITFDEMPYKAHFTIDGKHIDYYLSVERGSRAIELYITFDEEPSLVGKILSYSENKWVVFFNGKEYQLRSD